ncbi:MAG TPA: serine hydrolase domain-containing protein [Vicinamibacterales bacterium]|nr:serine hydrolase domain-containing protein [Vicinamibacterales bacterium]
MAVPQGGQNPPQDAVMTPPFEAYLEALRQQAGIPGLSAALVQDGQLIWERGFGFQNLEARIHATPDTPYPVADLSQTLAAVLLLQCVEYRRFDLDDQARQYGVTLPEPTATLRHLVSHTSEGTPGATFTYNPERYSHLTNAVEWCAPQPYRKTVAHRILDRLAMIDSVPGRDLRDRTVVPEGLFEPAALDRYAAVLDRMAVPYRVDKRRRAARSELPQPPEGINAATGLVASARDLAQFDAALDSVLLLEDTRAAAWRNAAGGGELGFNPAGLGWFVQTYQGQPVVWHFGLVPNAYSSLMIKLPAKRLTLILLANSDGLTAPYELHQGDVTRSVFAIVFLRLLG